MNAASGFYRDGRSYPTEHQLSAACDEYDRLSQRLGDNPNVIADHMGWSRGTGCVIRRLSRERAGLS